METHEGALCTSKDATQECDHNALQTWAGNKNWTEQHGRHLFRGQVGISAQEPWVGVPTLPPARPALGPPNPAPAAAAVSSLGLQLCSVLCELLVSGFFHFVQRFLPKYVKY